MSEPRYPNPHPDLMDLAYGKPCRSLGCKEVIGVWTDMTVCGVSGFCRACYDRLMADSDSVPSAPDGER